MSSASPLAERLARILAAVLGRELDEQAQWPLPALGVRLVVSREGDDRWTIRPWTGPWTERRDDVIVSGELREGLFRGPYRVHDVNGPFDRIMQRDEPLA